MKKIINLTINGSPYEVEVEPNLTLNSLLRDRLMLTGTKISCGEGECGACTVLIDGKPMLSCSMLAWQRTASSTRSRRSSSILALFSAATARPA